MLLIVLVVAIEEATVTVVGVAADGVGCVTVGAVGGISFAPVSPTAKSRSTEVVDASTSTISGSGATKAMEEGASATPAPTSEITETPTAVAAVAVAVTVV